MIYKIHYTTTTYNFNNPNIISQEVYSIIKKNLTDNPHAKFQPKVSFLKKHPVLFISLLILAITAPIVIIGLILNPKSDFINITAAPMGICFFITVFRFTEIVSFRTFQLNMATYYLKLRKIIIKSDNYEEFKKMYFSVFK